MKLNRKTLFIILIATFFTYIIYDSFFQPSENDLRGNFTEVAFYRNEQNTGPIVRIYAVTVNDTLWKEMKTYGDYKPHNKYGNTKVYFFHENQPAPTVLNESENFEQKYMENCIAKYEKGTMSQVVLVKYPFRNFE